MKYNDLIEEVEAETGKPITKMKQNFALHSMIKPDNNSESARAAGYEGNRADQRGYELANDSQVQILMEKLKKEIGDTNNINIKELVTQTLVNEVLTADAPRDRINAAVNLGKTEGMFKDVIETRDITRPEGDFLDEVEREFGKEARENAERKLH